MSKLEAFVRCRSVSIILFLAVLAATSPATAQTVAPEDMHALDWRYVGPQGNRVSAVVFDSNEPNIY